MNSNKTLIIYTPLNRPFVSAKKRWGRIEEELKRHEFDYDMIESDNSSDIGSLVLKCAKQHYNTLVIVGGDKALNEAVNSLMAMEKQMRDNIVLGLIPNGVMNDFATFWGFDSDNISYAVESLVQRRVRKIDTAYIQYNAKNGIEKKRYFLNCVNIGLLGAIQTLRQQMRKRLISRKLSFVTSCIMMLFVKKFFNISYDINFEKEQHRISTMCIGSSMGYGQTPNAIPYNGLLDITVVRYSAMSEILEALILFIQGKLLNSKRIMPYRTRCVNLDLDRGTPVSIDGHYFETISGKCKVGILQEEINFIIEKYNDKPLAHCL